MNHYCKEDEIPIQWKKFILVMIVHLHTGWTMRFWIQNGYCLRIQVGLKLITLKSIFIYTRVKKLALSLTILFQNSDQLWNSLPLIHSLLVIFPQLQVLLQEAAEANSVEHVLGKTSRPFPEVRVHCVSAKVPRMLVFFFRNQSSLNFLSSG